VKRDEMGRITVYRARAVIRGDLQQKGVDFGELYAPTVKKQIAAKFKVKDAGEATYFLGMSIRRERSAGKLWVGQPKYALGVLQRVGMQDCKPRSTPFDASIQLSKMTGEPEDEIRAPYQELVGALLYLSNCTRPDLAHAVGLLARFMSAPTEEHMNSAKQVLGYLAGTMDLGIQYMQGDRGLIGYSAADYAGDPDKRKSTSGNVFFKNGGAISWSTKLQPTVAASTCEAEFIAGAAAAKEALRLSNLFGDTKGSIKAPEISLDNQEALKLVHHPHAHQRTKHIDKAHRFVQDRVERGELLCSYVPTNEIAADCLTKAVPLMQLEKNKVSMGLVTKEFNE
jgi:hypothetical protein